MEYVYATLTLNETGREINEQNLTSVLEAAGTDVIESRVKAIVAALEDLDLATIGAEAGIPPAPAFEPAAKAPGEITEDAGEDAADEGAEDATADDPDTASESVDDEDSAVAPDEEPEPVAGDGGAVVEPTEEAAGSEAEDQ